jgi:hypothetical protein
LKLQYDLLRFGLDLNVLVDGQSPFTFFLDKKSNKKIKALEKKLKFIPLRYNG